MSEIENLHIKELTIDNYKSLKDSTIQLQSGLNIIIGKNGAGKSNLLEFIYNYSNRNLSFIFRRLPRLIVSSFTFSSEYTKQGRKNIFSYFFEKSKKYEVNLSGETTHLYEFSFSKTINSIQEYSNERIIGSLKEMRRLLQKDSRIYNDIVDATNFNRLYVTYNLPEYSFWVSSPNSLTVDEENNIEVEDMSDFSLLRQLESSLEDDFYTHLTPEIKNDLKRVKEAILDFLNNYLEKSNINHVLEKYSSIKQIRINKNINIFRKEDSLIIENLLIEFLIEDDWLPWSYLSDGTKRLFYLISECISTKKGIILIEEPELGIHPHQFYKVLDFLQEQAQTKQIIISTHSPMALDILKPNELDRITIAKYDKGTKFLKLTKKQMATAKKYMKEVGELSYYWLHSDLEND